MNLEEKFAFMATGKIHTTTWILCYWLCGMKQLPKLMHLTMNTIQPNAMPCLGNW